MSARRREAGFTLMELMIVVAIIAVVAALLIGVSSRTYGANSKAVSDQIAATVGMARMRAISTRRIHRVFIRPTELQVWASDTTGMNDDNNASDDFFVQRMSIEHGISVWDVTTTIYGAAGTANPSQNTSLNYELRFRPDGSSNGGTIFVFDTAGRKYRLPVYSATGTVYARANW